MGTHERLARRSSRNEATQAMTLSDMWERPENEQGTVVVPSGQPRSQSTPVEPLDDEPVTHSGVSRQQERERRRAERDRALGTRRRSVEDNPLGQSSAAPLRRTTDRFPGSLGLFVLRLVVAAIMGVHGAAKAMDIAAVQAMLTNTVVPEPVIMSYVLTGAELAIALALVFGLATRLAGLGVAAIGIGALVFVHWVTNPFVGMRVTGEFELLLAAVGVLLLCLSAGGWSIDGAIRRRRAAEA